MIVSAPLKNSMTRGVLLGKNSSPPAGRIKELSKIHPEFPVLSRGLLKILKWMAEYYIAPEGVVLKYTVPAEIFSGTKARKKKGNSSPGVPDFPADIPRSDLSAILASADSRKYGAFLMHAPSTAYEYSMVAALLGAAKNVIVLLPEVAHADFLHRALQNTFQERICLLHGEMPKGKRSENMEGIASGKHDIVIGTRPALFAPLRDLSLLIVLHEHSDSYKIDEGFRYHIRDVAVMRGFLEKCTVLLSSATPSVNSYSNALSKKYTLIKTPPQEKRPRVMTVDMRFEKKIGPNISKSVYEMARSRVRQGKKIMFVTGRRGYSTLILCNECGQSEDCPVCRIPLVMHNKKKILKCHYCGRTQAVPIQCGRCRSTHLELLGSGAQRIQESFEGLLGVPVFRFDSDAITKKSQISEMRDIIAGDGATVIVGTKMLTKHLSLRDKFSLAVVLNGDAFMNFPDFRSVEKTFMELSSLLELVELGGELVVQTRFPQKALFRYVREGDYLSFVRDELEMRKSLLYPPYSKLLQIRFASNGEFADRISKTLNTFGRAIEVLGPAVIKNRKGADEFSFLLRAKDRNLLKHAAQAVISNHGNIKGVKIFVEVDP